MNKKDRKAWIRIVEAFLAILIITSVLLIVMARQPARVDISQSVYEKQRQILDIVNKDDDLRAEILNGDNTQVNNMISQMVPSSWGFATKICELDLICNSNDVPVEKEIYATEVVISSTLVDYSPKKLRFFVWKRD